MNIDPTSHPPPDSPARYVEACSSPPMPPCCVEFTVRLSAAARKPAPFIRALYPPPDTAMPIFGSAVALALYLSMYAAASKPAMPRRESSSFIGATVLLRRRDSHSVSFADSESATRMVGRSAGQETLPGAYPPVGESGRARLMTPSAAAMATAAYSYADPSRGTTIVVAG